MSYRYPRIVEIVIATYCLLQSGVFNGLISFNLRDLSWFAFLIWVVPVVAFWVKRPTIPTGKEPTTVPFFGVALILTMIGYMASFNTLHYLATAFALAGLNPFYWQAFPWFILSASWMVAFRYLASKFLPDYLSVIQISGALIGTISHFLLVPYWRNPNVQ